MRGCKRRGRAPPPDPDKLILVAECRLQTCEPQSRIVLEGKLAATPATELVFPAGNSL